MTSPASSVRARYEALISSRTLDPDEAQAALVERLDRLGVDLAAYGCHTRKGPLAWLLRTHPEPPPRGLYVWGQVGRGKTMLMDLFHEGLAVPAKRRVHFHAYMAEVHGRIHAWRQKLKAGEVSGDDPIAPVAAELAEEATVLCFDEFVVTDIADAMLLGRLFTKLFAAGVTVVATSNVPPSALYKDGLNRALFVPFVELLEERTEVVSLDARTDFRLEKIGDTPVFFVPDGEGAERSMDELFGKLTGGVSAVPATLTVLGHAVAIPAQAMGIARFGFDDLCERPLGASDYLAIARSFHTVFVDRIPRLRPEQRNEVRRFITLIDVLYERHVKLVCSAAARPDDLYAGETGAEVFEFARTASRLHEMGSREYLAADRRDAPGGSSAGLVET